MVLLEAAGWLGRCVVLWAAEVRAGLCSAQAFGMDFHKSRLFY